MNYNLLTPNSLHNATTAAGQTVTNSISSTISDLQVDLANEGLARIRPRRSTINSQWDEFPSGTGAGDNNESGSHGRNIWDFENYDANMSLPIGQNWLTLQEVY